MIEIKGACKSFGRTTAMQDITFSAEPGKIIGLLGINGAGKSTTLKVIAGLMHLDSGEVLIDGESPSINTKMKIAYLPEIDILYPWMTIQDAINFTKDFYSDWDDKKAETLLNYFNLSPDMQIKKISKGMRAKVKLTLALSRRAKYLLLDEPLSGIDVLSREDLLKALVEDFLEEEQTIIITTHEVKEVENILDEIILIQNGEILLKGNLEELKLNKNMSLVDIMREVCGNASV